MDLWVVAAAAGAGYLAKYLQNTSSSEKESLSESSSTFSTHRQIEPRNLLQQIRDQTCPLRRLARERALADSSSEQNDILGRRILEMEQQRSGSISASTMASTSNVSALQKIGTIEDHNVLWLSSRSLLERMEFVDADGFDKFKLHKNRSSEHVLNPLSSVRSGLMPQLHTENGKKQEYMYSSLPSHHNPSQMPLLVTEGTQMISRSNANSIGLWPNGREDILKRDASSNENGSLFGSSSANDMDFVELQELESGSPERAFGKASYHHLPGEPNLMLLFMMGFTIGIMSSIVSNKRDVVKLNEQFQHTKNLVQDLQEELEMKDALAVKDLSCVGSQPKMSLKDPSLCDQEQLLVPEVELNQAEASEITSCDTKMADREKVEDPLLRSKIEAELEAELERLELNMKSSVLERSYSFVEIDPQFQVETTQEDMKLDLLRRQYDGSSESDNEVGSETPTEEILPANYAVSPRELGIRLHELIESRLEERIKELETALHNTQNRLQSFESRCVTYEAAFTYSEGESSSTPETPAFLLECKNRENRQLTSNLSENALDAYKEHGEMIRTTQKDEDMEDALFNHKNIEKENHTIDRNLLDIPNCMTNGSIPYINEEKSSSLATKR